MLIQDLSMVRGDDKQLVITVGDLPASGLAGYSAWVTVKKSESDADPGVFQKSTAAGSIAITTVGSDTVDGVLTVTIDAADTNTQPDYTVTYRWDCQLKDGSGKITTIAKGKFEIDPDETRTTA